MASVSSRIARAFAGVGGLPDIAEAVVVERAQPDGHHQAAA